MIVVTTQNLHSHKINDRKCIVQNFKTVVESQVELHSCKVEKLDVGILQIRSHQFYTFIIKWWRVLCSGFQCLK